MISDFRGKYAFLSNFSHHPLNGIPTVEHAFQAAKTHSDAQRAWVLSAKTPGEAKERGRVITLREDWEEVKLAIMHNLVWAKFYEHKEIRKQLLETGTQPLVEGNTWGDRYWGAERVEGKWAGQNWLGRILMLVRSRFHQSTPL